MYSVEFAEIEELQHQNRWQETSQILIGAAQNLEKAGADFIIICTNTMHKVYNDVQKHLQIPVLHIADATAEEIQARDITQIGLLGTRFTMEEDFYKGRLAEKYGLKVIIPSPTEMEKVHRVIYEELCAGKILESSKEKYSDIITRLVNEGAEGIILGCTEIGLLIKSQDNPVPLFDTTEIHANAAVQFALSS
jgi:aspartate racemase